MRDFRPFLPEIFVSSFLVMLNFKFMNFQTFQQFAGKAQTSSTHRQNKILNFSNANTKTLKVRNAHHNSAVENDVRHV